MFSLANLEHLSVGNLRAFGIGHKNSQKAVLFEHSLNFRAFTGEEVSCILQEYISR